MFKLPFWEKKNVRIYYILTAIQEAWFVESIFIYFILRFANYQELGVLDALSFIIGFLLEIPSGAIADRFGRKKTTFLSMSMTAFAIFLELIAVNKWFIFVGHSLYSAGLAFYSGAAEALAYDTLKVSGDEKDSDDVFEKAGLLTYFSFIIASIIGVALYKINFRLPYLIWLITFLVGVYFASRLSEVKAEEYSNLTFSSYLKTIKDGTIHLFSKPLVAYVPAILVFAGFYYMFDYGSIRAVMADFYGYKEVGQTIINTAFTVFVGILVSRFTEVRQKLGDRNGLILLSLIVSLGYLFGGIITNRWGAISIFLILFGGYLGYPWRSTFINKNTKSEFRATTISAVSFLMKLPYALLAVVFGYISQNNLRAEFCLAIGIVGVIFTVMTFVFSKNEKME